MVYRLGLVKMAIWRTMHGNQMVHDGWKSGGTRWRKFTGTSWWKFGKHALFDVLPDSAENCQFWRGVVPIVPNWGAGLTSSGDFRGGEW